MPYATTSADMVARPKRPYHAPAIERIGSIAEVTALNSAAGTADDANYGPATTS
jgi:hypothetical protein